MGRRTGLNQAGALVRCPRYGVLRAGTRKAHRMADGDVHSEDFWLMTGHHSVPEVVINRDGPEEQAACAGARARTVR